MKLGIDQNKSRRLTIPFAAYWAPREICAILQLLPADAVVTRAYDDYAHGGIGLIVLSETFSPIAHYSHGIPELKIIREQRQISENRCADVPVRLEDQAAAFYSVQA